jgi:hypothetical protein
VEESESDSDFDEKEYRVSLKTENYGIVKNQRSMVRNVVYILLQKIERYQS